MGVARGERRGATDLFGVAPMTPGRTRDEDGMRARARHIEQDWGTASLDQIADLHVWLYQRLPNRDADAVARWILAVNGGEQPRLSRRRLHVYREIVERFGPPRKITAQGF
jgi:hypothetical protein